MELEYKNLLARKITQNSKQIFHYPPVICVKYIMVVVDKMAKQYMEQYEHTIHRHTGMYNKPQY